MNYLMNHFSSVLETTGTEPSIHISSRCRTRCIDIFNDDRVDLDPLRFDEVLQITHNGLNRFIIVVDIVQDDLLEFADELLGLDRLDGGTNDEIAELICH